MAHLHLSQLQNNLKFRSIKNDNGTKLKSLCGTKDPTLTYNCCKPGQYLTIGYLSSSTCNQTLHIYDLFNDPFCKDGLYIYQGNLKEELTLDIRVDKTTRDKGKKSFDLKNKSLKEFGLNKQYLRPNIKELNFDRVKIKFDLFWRAKASESWKLIDSVQEDLFDEKFINNHSPSIEKIIPFKDKYYIIIDSKKSFIKKFDYFVEVRTKGSDEYRQIDTLICRKNNKKQLRKFYVELNHETDHYLRISSDHFLSKEFQLKSKHYKKYTSKDDEQMNQCPKIKIEYDDENKFNQIAKIKADFETTSDFPNIDVDDETCSLNDIEATFQSDDDELEYNRNIMDDCNGDTKQDFELPDVAGEMEVETSLPGDEFKPNLEAKFDSSLTTILAITLQ